MESQTRSLFQNLSPLDHRYYLANREAFDALRSHLSEEASIRYLVRVEVALLKAHLSLRNLSDPSLDQQLSQLESTIPPDEVYQEEEKTQHNIRALVNVLKRYVPDEVSPLVHAGATSADILDTALALRVKDSLRKVILPKLIELVSEIIQFVEQESSTPQVGRTHGQHAVPITLGFWMAEFASRLGKSVVELERLSNDLRGKLSGAVGAYNALTLMVPDPLEFERTFLSYLGIQPSEYSHQLVEPEYLLRLLLEINIAFGILANLADDLRNLQRSEIGEVREGFGKDQVGSSTMPQKRNPWNSEHVKSLWKAFYPRVLTFFADQISEHQRDLTNSASTRFIVEYLAGFLAAVCRMEKVFRSLQVDRNRLEGNLRMGRDGILAEAAYILLAQNGDPDAHEHVRLCTLEAERTGKSLMETLQSHPDLWSRLEHQCNAALGLKPETFFSTPELYRGKAREKSLQIARITRERMEQVKQNLKKNL
ncbi:MAG: lyase family protein [Spirochaetes bacterium]|nr:lyase family protein [Spirochaetota bacterium]